MPLFTNVLEGKFCELRGHGVLRSSSKKCRNLAHLRDTPTHRTGVCCLRCVASRRCVKAQEPYLPAFESSGEGVSKKMMLLLLVAAIVTVVLSSPAATALAASQNA